MLLMLPLVVLQDELLVVRSDHQFVDTMKVATRGLLLLQRALLDKHEALRVRSMSLGNSEQNG